MEALKRRPTAIQMVTLFIVGSSQKWRLVVVEFTA